MWKRQTSIDTDSRRDDIPRNDDELGQVGEDDRAAITAKHAE